MESWRRTDYVSEQAWLDRAAAALDAHFDRPEGTFSADSELNTRRLVRDGQDVEALFSAIDPGGDLDLDDLPLAAHFPASPFEQTVTLLLGLFFTVLGPLVFFLAPDVAQRWLYAVFGLIGLGVLGWALHRTSQILRTRREMAERGYSGWRKHPLTLRYLLRYRREPPTGAGAQEKAPDLGDPGRK